MTRALSTFRDARLFILAAVLCSVLAVTNDPVRAAVLTIGTAADPIPARCATFTPTDPPVTGAPTLGSTRYVPLSSPQRLFDTRLAGDSDYLCPGQAITRQVAGLAGVPATGATAVVLNVTGTASGGDGYVTVWPSGTARPNVSSLNFVAPMQTRPNLVIVPIGTDGKVNFYSQSGLHLIADVSGYFELSALSALGRLTPVTPERVLDTRVGNGATPSKPAAGTTLNLQVTGRGNVPSAGVAAVVMNVTGTGATGPGFVTVWPKGPPRPNASSLNLVEPGDTAANLVIMPVGADGQVSFFTEAGTHLLADVFGWFGDATQPISSNGLFVPVPPARVFDTRPDHYLFVGLPATNRPHTGQAGIPPVGVAAVALNVTGTFSEGGYITVWPTAKPLPNVSTLNLANRRDRGDTRANAAIVPVSDDPTFEGYVSYLSEMGAHVIVDTSGYFTAPV